MGPKTLLKLLWPLYMKPCVAPKTWEDCSYGGAQCEHDPLRELGLVLAGYANEVEGPHSLRTVFRLKRNLSRTLLKKGFRSFAGHQQL